MTYMLVILHILDALLVLTFLVLEAFTSDKVPVSWLTVVALDGMAVLIFAVNLAIHRYITASRVVWVALCYLLELLTKGTSDDGLVYGGAALVAYALTISIVIVRSKFPKSEDQALKEVVVDSSDNSHKSGRDSDESMISA